MRSSLRILLVALALAWAGLTAITNAIELEAALSWGTAGLAVSTSIAIGIIFGVAPA